MGPGADALQDDDYDWSAAVEEIDRIHRGELPQQVPVRISGPWGSDSGANASQHVRLPMNAVQRPLTSFFESNSQRKSLGNPLPAEEEDQAPQGGVRIDPDAAGTWIYPGNVSRREYQYQIVSRALYENVMVVLPTGLGKTFIAAVLMYNYFRWFPEGKVIFLAPSKPLVNQQVEACYGIMGIPQECTSELTGAVEPKVRKGLWQEKRVFFLTPQTLEMDLYSGTCPRESVVLIVFDEAHRATGNHSYCNIIREMQKVNARYRILALTATPGSDFQAIQNVIDNLCISRLEHRGEEHSEVAMYTHTKEKVLIKVAMDETSLSVRGGFHSVVQPILGRLCSFGAYYSKNVDSVTPWQLLEAKTKFSANPPAHVPQSNFSEISRLFNVAHSLVTALTLLTNDGVPQCYKYLEGKLQDNGPLKWHRDMAFDDLMVAMKQLVHKGAPTPKLLKLEEILAAHFERHDPAKTRVIIFSERRESVKDINEMLKKHAPTVRSTEFKGQASGKNNNKGQSQKRQQAVLREFREGAFNVIVSTSIGEEGLDVGEVDLVVCFDAAASPLRMVQRMGRTGRKRQGRVVILAAEGKEVRDYEKNQDKMRRIQRKMQNGGQDFNKHNSPRMVPHVFQPQMRTVIMDIPEFIHRGNVTVRTPLLVDPGTEILSSEEIAALARWPSTGHSWSPSLIAFSNFQSQPSKVHRIRHATRSAELFVGVLQRLHCNPPETRPALQSGDGIDDGSIQGLARFALRSEEVRRGGLSIQAMTKRSKQADKLPDRWVESERCVPSRSQSSEESLQGRQSCMDAGDGCEDSPERAEPLPWSPPRPQFTPEAEERPRGLKPSGENGLERGSELQKQGEIDSIACERESKEEPQNSVQKESSKQKHTWQLESPTKADLSTPEIQRNDDLIVRKKDTEPGLDPVTGGEESPWRMLASGEEKDPELPHESQPPYEKEKPADEASTPEYSSRKRSSDDSSEDESSSGGSSSEESDNERRVRGSDVRSANVEAQVRDGKASKKQIKVTPKRPPISEGTEDVGSQRECPLGASLDRKAENQKQTAQPFADLSPNLGLGTDPRSSEDLPLAARQKNNEPENKRQRIAARETKKGGIDDQDRKGVSGGELREEEREISLACCENEPGGSRRGNSEIEDLPLALRLKGQGTRKKLRKDGIRKGEERKGEVRQEETSGEAREGDNEQAACSEKHKLGDGQEGPLSRPVEEEGAQPTVEQESLHMQVSEQIPNLEKTRMREAEDIFHENFLADEDQCDVNRRSVQKASCSQQSAGNHETTVDEERFLERLVESQQESERPVASQFDPDMVVPDSGSEGEDDTWQPLRASQRPKAPSCGATKRTGRQEREVDRQVPRQDHDGTEKGGCERLGITDAKLAAPAEQGRAMQESPPLEERRDSGSECRVPETPCSQPENSQAEFEGEDCRVPETPDSQNETRGPVTGCQVAMGEARDSAEETPDIEALLMQEADALFEADVLQQELERGDDVSPLRELKPVPFPGFSPLPGCPASSYSLTGVVPETPESMAPQTSYTYQQTKPFVGLQQNGDQASWEQAKRSPFWEQCPGPQQNGSSICQQGPVYLARGRTDTSSLLRPPNHLTTNQAGQCAPIAGAQPGPPNVRNCLPLPSEDGFSYKQRQIESAPVQTPVIPCFGNGASLNMFPSLQPAGISGPIVEAPFRPEQQSAQPKSYSKFNRNSTSLLQAANAPSVSDPSPSQWERLNASLREQRTSLDPENAEPFLPGNLVSNDLLTAGQEDPQRPSYSPLQDGLPAITNPRLSLTSSPPKPANVGLPPPRLSLTPLHVSAPPVKAPGSELSDWEAGLIRKKGSQRSSGDWQAPAEPPSAEPPRKLRRLRKRKSGTEPTGTECKGTEPNGTEGDERKLGGRKQAMQRLTKGDQKQARKLASVFFDEEAEVSGSDEASDDDEESLEADDSFIDDRSQLTPSGGEATPSGGTEASPADMMALYRRSLLSQSPLEGTSPVKAPRFKSPPRAHANKNYGKMRFVSGRRDSNESGEEASLGNEASEEQIDEERGQDWPADKKRKLAFAGDNQWTSWQMPAAANGGEAFGCKTGNSTWSAKKPSLNPSFKVLAPREVNNFQSLAVVDQGIKPDASDARHVAADPCALEAADDDFLEGLDLDQLEAEALAARSQHAPRTVFSGHCPSTAVAAAAALESAAGFFAHKPSSVHRSASQEAPRGQGALSQTPMLRNRSALACGRLGKRTSLVEVDSMPSFDLGLD